MKKANILVSIQLSIFALMLVAFIIFPPEQQPLPRLLGLIMMCIGLAIVIIAIRQHKNGLNISPEPRKRSDLVETGPYQSVRHPIYTGVMISGVGAGLFHGHLSGLILALILIPFFTYKSSYEESLLVKKYPQYAHYKHRTGRFLPPFINR